MSKACDKCGRKISKGFSLIELMIVAGIILIIAAIAIPNLLRARIAANEASAVSSLRTINTACVVYVANYSAYPTSLTNLGPVASDSTPTSTLADLLDAVLTTSPFQKSGYAFTFAVPAGAYTINADPVTAQTGVNHFFTDASCVIRKNATQAASAADSAL